MNRLLNLGVILVGSFAAGSDDACCKLKTVGGQLYHYSGMANTSKYRCVSDCIYFKEGEPNQAYCFDVGILKSVCEDEGSSDQPTTPLALTYIDYWQTDQTLFSPPTVAEKGNWGPDEYCPEGAYVTSFQLYVAPICPSRCYKDDDVALMGMKLLCADYYAPDSTIAEMSSAIMEPCNRRRGLTCTWMVIKSCTGGQFIRKARYLSEFFYDRETEEVCPEGYVCPSDPMGGLNMDMECSDGTQLIGDGVMPEEIPLFDGQVTTYWSQWTACPAGYAICGIRSKVHQGETDYKGNMGQTEVLFHCCQLPPGFTG